MTIIHDSTAVSANIKFDPLKRYDEHNLSSEIYHQLKLLGIRSHLEYKHENSIFDLIVLDAQDNIKFIVEVKNLEHKVKGRTNTKQFAKYIQYNIPIVFVYKLSQIAEAIEYIKLNLIH